MGKNNGIKVTVFNQNFYAFFTILLSLIFLTSNWCINKANAENITKNEVHSYSKKPESNFLQSNNQMNLIDFYPTELENQQLIQIKKEKICDLDLPIRGHMAKYMEQLGEGYGQLIMIIKMMRHIAEDCQNLSKEANSNIEKLTTIYGPVMLQLLSFLNDIDEYIPLLPDNAINATLQVLHKTFESNPAGRVSVPFVFGEKFEEENAKLILENLGTKVKDNTTEPSLCYFLCFHPMVLTCNSDYILSNLCIEKQNAFDFADVNFTIPRYWEIKEIDGNDKYSFFNFSSKIDDTSVAYKMLDFPKEIKANTPKECLELLKDNNNLMKLIINDSDATINSKSIKKLGKADVLVLNYKSSSQKSGLKIYRQCNSYIFISSKNIFAYNYSVGSLTEKGSSESLERNKPLFEALVKATKFNYLKK